MARLLDDGTLEASSVVANCAMNRERSLTGSNGYGRELGLDVLAEITDRLGRTGEPVRWLDLCCGSGRALSEAAARLRDRGLADQVEITGVDLVDHFVVPQRPPGLRLVVASVTSWTPSDRFDLITCVHGLHYVGDKLGALARAASRLTAGGLLVANLDLRGIRPAGGAPAGRRLTTALRAQGFGYDPARRRISLRGACTVRLPYRYLGADDRAGPNYTGQPAVESHYEYTGR
ncbi:class I SAM-dependent methyltransferase [Actinomadura alba]|uniref:Class I SAM-dependent methyltransferase n=1 Tax=Actinomadura alba TaxID=406431 RepID=A0ABR7LVI9_9ACTN|nr:class I SAM-dependent methyltransferase [Actinomadura alba]MBC6468857.1 class I SAM-dependent methyltransferase [Actinomadura alba]